MSAGRQGICSLKLSLHPLVNLSNFYNIILIFPIFMIFFLNSNHDEIKNQSK